jgi:hypothetical protein
MQPAAAQKQKRGTKKPPHSRALMAPPAVKTYVTMSTKWQFKFGVKIATCIKI